MGTLQREPGKRLISRGEAKDTDCWSSWGQQTEVSCRCCLRNRPQNPKPEKNTVCPHLLHLGSLDKLPAKQSPPPLCSWHFKKHSFQELHFQMVVALLKVTMPWGRHLVQKGHLGMLLWTGLQAKTKSGDLSQWRQVKLWIWFWDRCWNLIMKHVVHPVMWFGMK